MIADSNSSTPLKYTDPTFQTLLFIRANIYDVSGVSPVLENTVNLTLIDNGTYWGKYTFTAGKPYIVEKLVYTDGTYTVVDQTFAQDNDDIQCINLETANLDAAISSRVSTSHFDTVLATIPTNPVLTPHFDAILGTPISTVSGDIAQVESNVLLIPTNPLLTNDSRLNHLDANISSRSTLTASGVWNEDLTGYNTIGTAGNDLKSLAASGGGSNVTNYIGMSPTLLAKESSTIMTIAPSSETLMEVESNQSIFITEEC